MKKLIVIFALCFITINSYAQRFEKSEWRAAPRLGECVAVTGASILGLKAVGLMGDRFNFHDTPAFMGYALIVGGVYIHIKQGNKKQRKTNWDFYASGDKIGFKLNF